MRHSLRTRHGQHIVVTGGTGQTGANVCERLIARGNAVRASARNPDEAVALSAIGVDVVKGDSVATWMAAAPFAVSIPSIGRGITDDDDGRLVCLRRTRYGHGSREPGVRILGVPTTREPKGDLHPTIPSSFRHS